MLSVVELIVNVGSEFLNSPEKIPKPYVEIKTVLSPFLKSMSVTLRSFIPAFA